MRIGITCRFLNSYFSGSTPQVACALAAALNKAGYEDVTLLYPKEDTADWFIDCLEQRDQFPQRKKWDDQDTPYDMLIEVVWSFPAELRPRIAHRVALFQHYPPIFHDMESSVYPANPTRRDFNGCSEVWTWSHYGKQDIDYLAFLSEKPVHTIPYIWNADFLDVYCKESGVPSWKETAALFDSRVTGDIPPSLSWCARVMESNMSNSSHCVVPLNIVSEIRKSGDPVRLTVHNGEQVAKNAFFQSNVAKNLILPDISGAFMPRIRLPDLCREKAFVLAHQRFRPLKSFLLDTLYLGIPLIHNCDMLKDFGYHYTLNQILDAVQCWKRLRDDYANKDGYFRQMADEERCRKLREMFGPAVACSSLTHILSPPSFSSSSSSFSSSSSSSAPRLIVEELYSSSSRPTASKEIRLALVDMWDDFNAEHNFFLSLLRSAGEKQGFTVRLDFQHPTLVVYGPFGETHRNYPGVPKVFYTGENVDPRKDADTFLNLGYQYRADSDYIRLPLWVLEINWFNDDPDLVRNPRPVPLSACLAQDPVVLAGKQKFCAFVTTNPRCQNRNAAFHILDKWRGVDSAGRLFCNRAEGPIPAGLGGGGGELAKVEFYKQYKYVIAYENASAPGYTTEKLFHAKVAGCVPIYWGDPFVDRDFDANGFLNANRVSSPEELIELVDRLEKNPDAWLSMASVPALSEFKRQWCERTMEEIVGQVVNRLFGKPVVSNSPPTIDDLQNLLHSTPRVPPSSPTSKSSRCLATFVTSKSVESAKVLIESFRKQDVQTSAYVYISTDVDTKLHAPFESMRAQVIPTSIQTLEELWQFMATSIKEDLILFVEPTIDIVGNLRVVWDRIEENGVYRIQKEGGIWNECVGFRRSDIHRIHNDSIQRIEYLDVCSDHSLQLTQNRNLLFYVHGGNPVIRSGFLPGIEDIYVINLERRSDRLASFFKNAHMKRNANVWKATDGKTLQLTQDLVRLFKDNDFKWKKSVMGCAISHSELWVKLANDPYAKGYLICEDDARFADNWAEVLSEKLAKMPADADVIYLGGVLPPNKPAFDSIVEPVGGGFARVAKNTLFGGERRYFHFCNYSYILTKSGAQKLCELIKQRGIFTSGDHMIVNHGDSFLRIYFTTPLLTTCIQENDPVYQTSNFNDFSRIDTFDSDLWNNNDRFTQEELLPFLAEDMKHLEIKMIKEPLSDEEYRKLNQEYIQKRNGGSSTNKSENDGENVSENVSLSKDEILHRWNTLLMMIAQQKKDGFETALVNVLDTWKRIEDVRMNMNWFRIFEQMIKKGHPLLISYIPLLLSDFTKKGFLTDPLFAEMKPVLEQSSDKKTVVFYLEGGDNPIDLLEGEWFNEIFPSKIEWRATNNARDLAIYAETKTPILLYQSPPGKSMVQSLRLILDIFQKIGKRMILLHVSDEFAKDDITVYQHPAVKHVLRNYWRPSLPGHVTVLPLGYAKGRGNRSGAPDVFYKNRSTTWTFVGSADRPGRMTALNSLHSLVPYTEKLKPRWDDPMIAEGDQYVRMLKETKFVPCMKGSAALETFRLYEALESGAIPFYIPSESHGCQDEYTEVLGTGHPLLALPSWSEAPKHLERLIPNVEVMESYRQKMLSWWSQKKTELRTRLEYCINL